MKKLHVNPENGNISLCKATQRACPLGGAELHFNDPTKAKEFSENLMSMMYETHDPSKKAGKLIIFVGIPGSGKSTLAKKLAEETPGAILLNRDDMRTELAGEKYHNGNPQGKIEAAVTAILKNKLTKQLRDGGVAIDDNTNTNARFLNALIQTARNYGAEVEIRTVNTPVAEAKRRNKLRGAQGGREVPEHVIDKMASKLYSEDGNIKDVVYNDKLTLFVDRVTPGMKLLAEYNAELERDYPILSKDIAIVDIDGTLSFNHEALDRHVGALAPGAKKDWMAFYKESESSPVNESVLRLIKKLRTNGVTVFAITGRVDEHANSTITFLRSSGAPISRVIMGRAGDYRGDYTVKNAEVASLEKEGFVIVHSIDDRPSSIRVWEERGISVSRVPHHEVGLPQESYTQSMVDDITGQGFCVKCSGELEEGLIIHEACRSE